ncbi:unnamed protein product [Rotaria sordida]|uniref:Uncharacterized protein n=1 Tax=Rotaria sordida TaxID=392033 RepID=A0A819Z8B7_9BILA|nr:unnamed protein product [Rotaria sordida]
MIHLGTKILRICGDCHEHTKLVAKARQRDIIYLHTFGYHVIKNFHERNSTISNLTSRVASTSTLINDKCFVYSLLEKLFEYVERASITIQNYKETHRNYFIVPPLLKTGVNYASVKEEEMNCSLFCKLALLLRQKFSAFGNDVNITVRCLKVLVRAIDVSSVMKNSQEMIRASLLPLFNNIAEDLNQTVQNLEQKHYSNIKGTLQRGTTSLAYIHIVFLSVLSSLLDHLGKNNYGVDVFGMTFTR